MKARHIMIAGLSLALFFLALIAAAVIFGGPKAPPPMASINNPFTAVDFSDLPALAQFKSNDGTLLAYRAYLPEGQRSMGSLVLVHGSSASSNSMHLLAKGFARAGYTAFALDIRGHGASGNKGEIAYIGQLEDDLESFVREVAPATPSTLVGFSAGGGFVLRFAGSTRQDLFQSYLLLSPFLSQDAPTYRAGSGGWVNVGVPRVIALSMLDALGIRWFNNLPVTRFALNEEAKAFLTAEYSFALSSNFRPRRDYEKNIKEVRRPCAVLAGVEDEAFYTEKLEPTFRALGKQWQVKLLPGIGHISLILDARAVAAAVSAVGGLQANGV